MRPVFVAAGLALLGGALLVAESRGSLTNVVANDKVDLKGTNSDPEAIVLVSGRRAGNCDADEEHRGWGTVPFPAFGDWGSPSARCKSELVVFSLAYAAYSQRDPWTNSVDLVTPTLQDRLAPKLNIWLVSDNSSDLGLITTDTLQASALFTSSRIGVTFGTKGVVTMIPRTHPRADSIGLGCENTYMLLKSAPPMYDPEAINIYYVPRIDTGSLFDVRGYTCFEWGAPNVIFISLQDYTEVTLAHELGHAFGLRGGMGHTKTPRFTKRNIMQSGLDEDEDDNRDHFTLGQAYRMNLDESSLLHRLFPNRMKVWCQDKVADIIPCPQLQRKAAPP